MAEKVTIMVIKVDLQCPRCYKKIKKVLCKIPQVRDQVFDEKQNTVIITVISCCPERIKQKICCKGGDTIKGIEIKEPEKKKEPEKTKAAPEPEKKKEPEKTKAAPEPEKKKEPEKTKAAPEPEKKKEPEKTKEKPKEDPVPKKPEPEPVKMPPPVICYPPAPPMGVCCRECYEGQTGGPCYQGWGRPAPPPPCWEGYGRPVYDSWGCGGGNRVVYCGNRNYFCEENPSGCTIM